MLISNFVKLNRSLRRAVFAALIAIGAIAIYNWTVDPYMTCLMAAQRYESAADKIARKKKAISEAIEIRKRELQELDRQSNQLHDMLFTPDKAREFFSDLPTVAQQAGCEFISLNFIDKEQSSTDKQYEIVTDLVTKSVVLSVIGDYANIINLMERLQPRTQKVWVDSINIRTPNDGSDYPVCEIAVNVFTIQKKEVGL
jgi:hypothetical protein